MAAALLALFLVVGGCACHSKHSRSFDFALIGDAPYNDFDATNSVPNMMEEIDRARLEFVVHDGDIKSGASPCTDEVFQHRFELFQRSRHPFILIPGDNEWCDCAKAGFGQPVERLQRLREIFYADEFSLGKRRLPLERQETYRENVRWVHGNVLFAGLNIPGGINDCGQGEAPPRNRANFEWLRDAFAKATKEKRSAVMIIIQANPRFDLGSTNRIRAGFNEFLTVLERETIAFQKPVVLVHGDTHYFRIDKPIVSARSKRRVENFTRVETFGNPDVHWLRVHVDPKDPNVFTFFPQLVKKNFVHHDRPAAKSGAE